MADVLSTEVDAICIDTLDDIWLESFVRTHPFLDRLSIKKAGGSGYRIPVQTGGGGGTSGNFADSLANSAANGFTGTAFTVPPAIAYGTERIQWQDAVLADTEQSPVDLAMNATKNALNIAVENLSNMIIGSSSGAAGSYSTISTDPGWRNDGVGSASHSCQRRGEVHRGPDRDQQGDRLSGAGHWHRRGHRRERGRRADSG